MFLWNLSDDGRKIYEENDASSFFSVETLSYKTKKYIKK